MKNLKEKNLKEKNLKEKNLKEKNLKEKNLKEKNLKEYLEKSILKIKELIYNSEEKHLKIDELDDFKKVQLIAIYSRILQKIEKDEVLFNKVSSILGKIIDCEILNTEDLENLLSSYLETGDSKDITDYFDKRCKKKSGGSQSGGYKNKTHKNKRHKKSKKGKKSKKNNSKRNMVFFGGAYPDHFLAGNHDSCPICLEDFEDPKDYIVLHAEKQDMNKRHNFHRTCIYGYSIQTVNSCENGKIVCPICKVSTAEFLCPQGNNANNVIRQRGFDPLREQLNDEMEQLIQMQHLLHGHARMPNAQEELEASINRHQIVRFLKEILRILPGNIRRAMNDIDVIMFMTVIIFFIKSLFDRP
jgi:hypothetical protein